MGRRSIWKKEVDKCRLFMDLLFLNKIQSGITKISYNCFSIL